MPRKSHRQAEERIARAAEADGKPLAVSPDGYMTIGGFEFQPTALVPVNGPPDFELWERVGRFLEYAHTGVQFWIGDWLNFGEEHYGERYTQAIAEGPYEESTLRTYAWVARNVPRTNRFQRVPFGHYLNIAALPPDQQVEWARRVVEQNLSQGELRTQLRLAKRAEHHTTAALPEGKFRIYYIDCPWQYDDSGVIVNESGTEAYGRAERHYPTMSIEELIAFFSAPAFQNMLLPDAMAGFWVTAPLLLQNPGPREVIAAAGFEPKTQFIWDKVDHNYGHYNSVRHELLIICTRGSCTPDEPTPMPDSVVTVKPEGKRKHSGKPEIFRKIITKLWTTGPYIELFGRKPVEGWTVYGNDLALDIDGNRRAADGPAEVPADHDEVAASGGREERARYPRRGRLRGSSASRAADSDHGEAAGVRGDPGEPGAGGSPDASAAIGSEGIG